MEKMKRVKAQNIKSIDRDTVNVLLIIRMHCMYIITNRIYKTGTLICHDLEATVEIYADPHMWNNKGFVYK